MAQKDESCRPRLSRSSLGDIWRDWKWIWTFSCRRWRSILLYTVLGLMASALSLVSGVAGKYLIDSIIALDLSRLALLIGLTLASTALMLTLRSVTSRFSAKLNISMQNDVQAMVFDSLMGSDWVTVSKYPTGDLLNRFSGDVSTVSGGAISFLPTVIIQLFTVLATLGVILYYDPVMALICCASAPLLLLTSRALVRRQRDYNRKMREVSSDLYAFESEAFRNLDTLKGLGVEGDISNQLRRWQGDYKKVALEYNGFTIRTNVWLTVLSALVQALALGYCLWQLWQGQILIGTMVLFLQQRSSLQTALSSLIGQVPAALSGSIAAERVRELTELPKEPPASRRAPMPRGGCRIRMENVRAAYGPGRTILSGVDIEAGPGDVVALVGPSGEGKTTLLRLLLGLVRPVEGTVSLEDGDGRIYPLGAPTRHWFSYVPQGNTLLAGTVADNLRLAKPDATEAEMISALDSACAWEFVSRMPKGLNSPLLEGGKGLSEGQAQRIAIARALIRQAPAMLLDEVTSALDRETESRVLRNLMDRGVTCIVTTHRLSVISQCSRVYRVRGGRVTCLTAADIEKLSAPPAGSAR